MATDRLRKHRRHLRAPDERRLAERLEMLAVDRARVDDAPPVVVGGRTKKLRIDSRDGFSPPSAGELKAHLVTVSPRSLDHLKDLVGAPDAPRARRAAGRRREQRALRMRRVDDAVVAGLPKTATMARLSVERQNAVLAAGYNLVHGQQSAALLKLPGYRRVEKLVLDLSRRLPAFVGSDLIVEDGARVTFVGFGLLYFNNVLVYGDGAIRLPDNAKLHANRIAHI